MVNNAGIGVSKWGSKGLHLMGEDQWDETMTVNAKSVFLGCKYAITQMLGQDPHESGDRGWIVNTSSIGSVNAIPGASTSLSSLAPAKKHVCLTKQLRIVLPREPSVL